MPLPLIQINPFSDFCFNPDIVDSDEPDISPPPLHSVREEERAAKVLQDIGRGQGLKRAENLDLRRSVARDEVHSMQDYEDIGGRHEGGILKRAEDLERFVQGGEVSSMQGCGERGDVDSRATTEGSSATFEWVDFKRNGEFQHQPRVSEF